MPRRLPRKGIGQIGRHPGQTRLAGHVPGAAPGNEFCWGPSDGSRYGRLAGRRRREARGVSPRSRGDDGRGSGAPLSSTAGPGDGTPARNSSRPLLRLSPDLEDLGLLEDAVVAAQEVCRLSRQRRPTPRQRLPGPRGITRQPRSGAGSRRPGRGGPGRRRGIGAVVPRTCNQAPRPGRSPPRDRAGRPGRPSSPA